MRSLQKVSHQRPRPIEDQLEFLETQRGERRFEARRKRLRAFLRVMIPLGAIGLLVWVALGVVAGLRRTADALVIAEEVVFLAPRRVRVAEVHVQAGDILRADEPLLRLEAVEGTEELQLAALEVERARRRLAWFDAGGELAPFGEPLRSDRVSEAHRQVAEADLALATANARVIELEREHAAKRAALAAADRAREGQSAVLGERLAGAEAELEQARATLQTSRFDAHAAEHLSTLGVATAREAVARDAARRADEEAAIARSADRRALEGELATSLEVDGLADVADSATLAAVDAALEVARREALALERRAALWRDELARQERLDPAVENDPALVRVAARALHEIELELAEARYRRLEHELGGQVLRAPADGVVTWVAATAGSVVDRDALLLRLRAEETLRVVAYPTPDVARETPRGTPCRIHPADGGPVLDGVVEAVAGAWVPIPDELPARAMSGADLRVPVQIRLEASGTLVPGARCKIVFDEPAVSGAGNDGPRAR